LSQQRHSYNNTKLVDFVDRIYPIQVEINAAENDKAYQLLAHGRWFSPDTSASSTTKTGRLDIAEIDSEGPLRHYHKSDDFNYDFVSFPFIHSSIPGTY
jgi:hypothetical protein